MRETIRKKLLKPRKTFAHCGLIAKNVEGGLEQPPPPPPLYRVNPKKTGGGAFNPNPIGGAFSAPPPPLSFFFAVHLDQLEFHVQT